MQGVRPDHEIATDRASVPAVSDVTDDRRADERTMSLNRLSRNIFRHLPVYVKTFGQMGALPPGWRPDVPHA